MKKYRPFLEEMSGDALSHRVLNLRHDNIVGHIFDDDELSDLIVKNSDPWKDTRFAGYKYLDPKQKGIFGEIFTSKYMETLNCKVVKTSISNGPYDRYISRGSTDYMIPTEIKFSLANKNSTTGGVDKDKFIINHIGFNKEWERLIFVCINGPNPEDWRIYWFNKLDFKNHIENDNRLFNRQQDGRSGGNDDWMCSPPKSRKLFSEPWVYDISSW